MVPEDSKPRIVGQLPVDLISEPCQDLKSIQNNGPISQDEEYSQYNVHYFGHFGGPPGSYTPKHPRQKWGRLPISHPNRPYSARALREPSPSQPLFPLDMGMMASEGFIHRSGKIRKADPAYPEGPDTSILKDSVPNSHDKYSH